MSDLIQTHSVIALLRRKATLILTEHWISTNVSVINPVTMLQSAAPGSKNNQLTLTKSHLETRINLLVITSLDSLSVCLYSKKESFMQLCAMI